MNDTPHLNLARKLASLLAELPQVTAVALGGSQTSGSPDPESDIDLYVYTQGEISLAARWEIVEKAGGSSRADMGLAYWGPGDEWYDALSGIEVDLVYFEAAWMEAQLRRVIIEQQASLGYSTCFWYTVRGSLPLYDPEGWFARQQTLCRQDYPEALRQNIVALNHPVLRDVIPAYANQIGKALKRGDLVSLNHRLAALLASYFDILLALNRQFHPGEKRLVEHALMCEKLPVGMAIDLEAVLAVAGAGDPALMAHLTRLLDRLDALLRDEGFELPA